MAESSAKPVALPLEAGTHALCTCGQSRNGAFCDGSHKGSGKTPHLLTLEQPTTVYLCSCGASARLPFCDGSHANAPAAPILAT